MMTKQEFDDLKALLYKLATEVSDRKHDAIHALRVLGVYAGDDGTYNNSEPAEQARIYSDAITTVVQACNSLRKAAE